MSTERQCLLHIATGEMGIGKSFLTKKIAKQYHQAHPNRAKLIFDPNGEWDGYDTIYFDVEDLLNKRYEERKLRRSLPKTKTEVELEKLRTGCRIITPYTRSGQKMNPEMLQETMVTAMECFRGGLIVLDDINAYVDSFQETRIKGVFKNIRHKSQDIILHMQSLNPLRPIHYEAATIIRMHHDSVDVERIKSKAQDKTTVLKISQNIVEQVYNMHLDFDPVRQKDQFYAHRSYCTYVNLKAKSINGCSFAHFEKACNQYLTHHKELLKPFAEEIAHENRRTKPSFQDLEVARTRYIAQKLREGMFDRTKASELYKKILQKSV